MLERPFTNRFSSHSCDVQNEFYGTLNEVILLHAYMYSSCGMQALVLLMCIIASFTVAGSID